MRALGAVVSKISHDLNNHLTVINGFSELVLLQLQSLDQPSGNVEQILRSAGQIADMTGKFQVYSRRALPHDEQISLRRFLLQWESDFRTSLPEGIELILDLPEDSCRVAVEGDVLHEILRILAANACEAMAAGGQLRICAVRPEPPDSGILLTVTDSGHGLEDAAREHLFEPFFTTREGHKGFGLFTAYGLVRRAKGSLRIGSEKGRGTRVTIRLPECRESF